MMNKILRVMERLIGRTSQDGSEVGLLSPLIIFLIVYLIARWLRCSRKQLDKASVIQAC